LRKALTVPSFDDGEAVFLRIWPKIGMEPDGALGYAYVSI